MEEDKLKETVPAADKPLPTPPQGPAPPPKEHPDDKIARANAAAERLEKVTALNAKQLEEMREIEINRQLGGGSAAGTEPAKAKEETPAEYAARVMAGDVEDGS